MRHHLTTSEFSIYVIFLYIDIQYIDVLKFNLSNVEMSNTIVIMSNTIVHKLLFLKSQVHFLLKKIDI